MKIGIDFTSWLKTRFGLDDSSQDLAITCVDLEENIAYRQFAVNACINLIAQTISLAEFQTFEKGKETRKDLYYLLNVEPNQNQSASDFWRAVVEDLVHRDKALIVPISSTKWLKARDWDIEERAMVENRYKRVDVGTKDVPFLLKESFKPEGDVLCFRWHNLKVSGLMDSIYTDFSKLISSSQSNYVKGTSSKGILEVGTEYAKTVEAQERLNVIVNEYFKKFFAHAGSAVMPLDRGLSYKELSGPESGSTSANLSREARNFVDDVFDLTAMSFGFSSKLLRGDVADLDDLVRQFITFCINPIAEIITDEINRKVYGKQKFLERTYCKLDTTRIRAVDIKDIASSLDILLRSGAYTINDSLRVLGKEPIDSEIGDQRFLTKNYAVIEDVVAGTVQKGVTPLEPSNQNDA